MTEHTPKGEALAPSACFDLGRTVATPGAIEALAREGGDWRFNAAVYLARHQDGDWGDVPSVDARENEFSVLAKPGFRIVSSYATAGDNPSVRLWIITEADRSSTCILLPDEY